MRERGFSIIELVVVLAIISTLLAIATMQFNTYTRKSQIEAQLKMINADLAEVRVRSLYQKQPRAVVISGTQFSVYASLDTSVAAVTTKTLGYPMVSNGTGPINFDSSGLLSNVSSGRSLCVDVGANPAAVDSIVLSTSRIYLGKWNLPEGSDEQCKSDNIKQQ